MIEWVITPYKRPITALVKQWTPNEKQFSKAGDEL